MVVTIEPEDFENAPVVLVGSDGANDQAIREIDGWAREHGFVRSGERNLNVRRTSNGAIVHFSACYPLSDDILAAARAANARMNARRERLPETTSSVELVQDER